MLLQPTGSVLGWLHIKWAGPSAAWTGLCCKHPWDQLLQPLFVLSSGILCTCYMQMQLHFSMYIFLVWHPPTSAPHPDLQAVFPCPQGLWWICWQQCIPWASQWCSALWGCGIHWGCGLSLVWEQVSRSHLSGCWEYRSQEAVRSLGI